MLPDRVRALDGSVTDVDVRRRARPRRGPQPCCRRPSWWSAGDPEALAELLDLPLAVEIVAGTVVGTGTPTPWRALAEIVVTCDTLGIPVPEGTVVLHDELWIELTRPEEARRRVPTWYAAGEWHAEDAVRALLSLLA